jgi:hypothetical protein
MWYCIQNTITLSVIKHYATKVYGDANVQIHVFLTLAIDEGERSTSRPGRFNRRERASRTPWIGGWVGQKEDFEGRRIKNS